ncbi:methyltransferase [Pelagivirga sediminicola]|uniref:Methyltransferase n=1 Tax=Pelagivirga sediminicola TaxID=2170575 RepID=A0A2T7G529_9RHOB|nr:DUF938 domain-containing protein [Pelagivirga sediminicola]PVA09515.1 methyltransferase [Pelagivirga sediminicola]
MPLRTNLPPAASVAEQGEGARLSAPSAVRNAPVIAEMLAVHGPHEGRALELASGTGQHVIAFAAALPHVDWQPSDIDPSRRASIDAWAHAFNIRAAIALDATAPGWSADHAGQNMIVLVNLLHLISEREAHILLHEVSLALAPGGLFALYGPFLRDGKTVSEADAAFDASLRAGDPDIGYKDAGAVQRWMRDAGLHPLAPLPMPANNLMFLAHQPL